MWEADPFEPARKAIAAADLHALQRVVEQHPQLLDGRDHGLGRQASLLGIVMAVERRRGVGPLRPIME
jgi:hypothetical protein